MCRIRSVAIKSGGPELVSFCFGWSGRPVALFMLAWSAFLSARLFGTLADGAVITLDIHRVGFGRQWK